MRTFRELTLWWVQRRSLLNFPSTAQASQCKMLATLTTELQAYIGTYLPCKSKLNYGIALAGSREEKEERMKYWHTLNFYFPHFRTHFIPCKDYRNSYVELSTTTSPFLPVEDGHVEAKGQLTRHLVAGGSVCIGCRHIIPNQSHSIPTLYSYAPIINLHRSSTHSSEHNCCFRNQRDMVTYVLEIYRWDTGGQTFGKSTHLLCSEECYEKMVTTIETYNCPIAMVCTKLVNIAKLTSDKRLVVLQKNFTVSPHLMLTMEMLSSNVMMRYTLECYDRLNTGRFLQYNTTQLVVLDPNDVHSMYTATQWAKVTSTVQNNRDQLGCTDIYNYEGCPVFKYEKQDIELLHFYARKLGMRADSPLLFFTENGDDEILMDYEYTLSFSYNYPLDGWDVDGFPSLSEFDVEHHNVVAGNLLWNFRLAFDNGPFIWLTAHYGQGLNRSFNMFDMEYRAVDLLSDETLSDIDVTDTDSLMSD